MDFPEPWAAGLLTRARMPTTPDLLCEPHPPRRAHDTLQPPDESIIVGYYTSAGSAPRPAGRTNVKGALWRETTGLTVPVQET